jgi:type-F conjugative transfer system pilin assembly protein TrbC
MAKNKLLLTLIVMLFNYSSIACNKEVQERKKDLLIFVSSSIPARSLKNYIVEAQRLGGQLIIKGLVDGSFIKTRQFIQSLSPEASIQIDEAAFEQFGITKVPAIVLVKDDEHFDKVYGNITISAALDLFTQEGEVKNAN